MSTGVSAEPAAGPTAGPPRRRRRALVGSLGVGAVGVVLVAVLATRSTAPAALATSTLGGKTAPAIFGRDLRTGAPVSLESSLDGGRRYVLVDFFASWCVPCQQEMPQLEAWVFAHRATVTVLGVDISDSSGNGSAFLRKYGATWPAIEDRGGSGRASVAYGVASPPQLFLVAPSGRVVAYLVGAPSVAQLDAALEVAESGRVQQ